LYESYFGLTERPFSIAPDPDYLYMSSRHKEAMAHLSYGLSQGGCFIVLTGEVGTGKTTLCRNLLTDLPSNVDVALILNANLGSTELLQTVCDELKIKYTEQATQKQLLDLINAHLLKTFAENRHTVLIIDEAQLLTRDVLEQIRLLTNLETTKSKLLQIILIGQPELYDLLSRNDLRQLAQRVTARYHLGALERNEIEEYINCRLSVAGCKQPLFSGKALNKIHSLTDGIPRKINVLADQALLATYSQNKTLVEASIITKTAKEVFITTRAETTEKNKEQTYSRHFGRWAMLGLILIGLNLSFWWYTKNETSIAGGSPQVFLEGNQTLNETSSDPVVEPDVEISESQNSQIDEVLTSGKVTISESFLTVEDDDLSFDVVEEEPLADVTGDLSLFFDEDTSLGSLLDASADLTGRISMLRALALQWGEVLPDRLINPVCDEVRLLQLHCLGVSDWSNIENYNRPAIVILKHREKLHRVLIQSIDKGLVTLGVGSKTQQVTVNEITQRWNGSGLIFWRAGVFNASHLKQGDQGDSVLLARLQLNEALNNAKLGSLLSVDSLVYDQDMTEKVRLLQLSYGLLGDGVIGSETYLLINELSGSGVGTPVLRQRFGEVLN